MHKQLVVQAQHDLGIEVRGCHPHGGGPRLEELRGGALNEGVAGVPAPAALVDDPRSRNGAAPEGAQGRARRPRGIRTIEEGHGVGVGAFETGERSAGGAAALAVHRGEHGNLGHGALDAQGRCNRGVEVVRDGGGGEGGVCGDRGQDPGLDLAEVGANETPPGRCGNPRAQRDRQIVETIRGGHPAGGPIARVPLAAKPIIGADVRVQPGVPVGCRDALIAAPGEERGDDRMGLPVGLKHPFAGRRDVDPDRGKHRPHVRGVAQVAALMPGGEGEDPLIALRPQISRVGLVGGARSGCRSDVAHEGAAVDRQAVAFKFDAQERSGRFGHGQRLGARPDRGELCPQETAAVGSRLCPLPQPVIVGEPAARHRVRTQIACGAQQRCRVPSVAEHGKQVVGGVHLDLRDVVPLRARPHHTGIGAPPAVEDPVAFAEVEDPREDLGAPKQWREVARRRPHGIPPVAVGHQPRQVRGGAHACAVSINERDAAVVADQGAIDGHGLQGRTGAANGPPSAQAGAWVSCCEGWARVARRGPPSAQAGARKSREPGSRGRMPATGSRSGGGPDLSNEGA